MEMWEETQKRSQDEKMKSYLGARKRFSEFGMYSKQRDTVYAKGQVDPEIHGSDSQGNVSEALSFAEKQLSVYQMPDVLYDMATMEV
jgi:hypothetical protein